MFTKIIIIALLSLILTGCSNNNSNDSLNNNPPRINRTSFNDNNNNSFPENNSNNDITSGEGVLSENTESGENYVDDIKKDIYGKKDDLAPNTTEDINALSTFSTPILTSDPNRYHNITLVRDRLNGYVLKNNESFSFNEVCGPYGQDDGFKEATILLSNGKEDKGYGGGVCQLSTTLYNAIKKIDNVEITERHQHSTPVAYVPKDQDATVSLQSNLDLKFKNVSGKNLRFESDSTENSLTVRIYAE